MEITEFKTKNFRGSNTLWNYVVINASLRSYIIYHDQSGLSRPNQKGKGDIHNIIFTST